MLLEIIEEHRERIGIVYGADGDDIAFHSELVGRQAKSLIDGRAHHAGLFVSRAPDEQRGRSRVYLNGHVVIEDIVSRYA